MKVGHTDSPATPGPDELGRGGPALEQVAGYLRQLVDRDLPGMVAKNVELFELLRKSEGREVVLTLRAERAQATLDRAADNVARERAMTLRDRGHTALWAFGVGAAFGVAVASFFLRS